jgi:membrane fusion protein, adhesin transport system
MKNRHRLSQQLDDSINEAKGHWRWLIGEADPADASSTKDIESELKRSTHLFLMILIALCLVFFLWACLGHLDVASTASGEVFPSSQMKTIQHLEGGIVQEILVKEGEKVHAGQALVTLESTASGADVQQLHVQIAALNIDIVRLKAELDDFKPLQFQKDLSARYPKLTRSGQTL